MKARQSSAAQHGAPEPGLYQHFKHTFSRPSSKVALYCALAEDAGGQYGGRTTRAPASSGVRTKPS